MTDPADLEHRLTRALRLLETPAAPVSLLPRVMAGVLDRARTPWYRREWRSWPLGWQMASGTTCGALLSLALLQLPSASGAVGFLGDTSTFAAAITFVRKVQPALAALQVVWRVVVDPIAPILLAFTVLLGLVCVALGLTLNYVAFGRTSQS